MRLLLKKKTANNYQFQTTKKKSVYVYNEDKTTLLHVYSSVNAFIKVSGMNGSDVKSLCLSNNRLWLNSYFITYNLLSEADNSLINVVEFDPQLPVPKSSIPVYRYNSDGSQLIERYPSIRHCVQVLHGDRNYNVNTLKLRILHKELYQGFRVSYSPLNYSDLK